MDGILVTLRCNACGATSQVDVGSHDNDDSEKLAQAFGTGLPW
ncbi:MAG TPA: hypothetical protein VFA59_18210 [Vicinamibacterales bacterium]|nr:hypothetical protein [Vicinamibacterales bacterium]